MSAPRIPTALLVLPEPPRPFGGAASRWYYVLLGELIDRGFKVTALVCTGGPAADAEAIALFGSSADLRFFPVARNGGVHRIGSLLYPVGCHFSRCMREALYSLKLSHFDLILFETHATARLVSKPIDRAILNVHNLFSIDWSGDRPESAVQVLLRHRTLMGEREMVCRFRRVTALTDRLCMAVKGMNPSAEVKTVPMTIDFSVYTRRGAALRTENQHPTLGLIGSFSWPPTRSAAITLLERIWPSVAKKLPNTRLLFAGRDANGSLPSDVLRRDDVSVVSDPHDIAPFFHGIDAFVYLPTVGSGMKVKVLEAIAMEIPIVTNSEGAEGLPTAVKNRICVSTDDEAVERILSIISSPERSCKAASELRAITEDQLSTKTCVDRVLAAARAENCQSQSATAGQSYRVPG